MTVRMAEEAYAALREKVQRMTATPSERSAYWRERIARYEASPMTKARERR